jgi:hypothetical protein
MNPEDRLRQAINDRTNAVQPSADGLTQIQEKLMEAQRRDQGRNHLLIGLGAAAAIVAVVIAAVVLTGDDDKRVDSADPGSSTTIVDETTTSTTAPPSTTTTAPPVAEVDPSVPLFPVPSDGLRYDDPKVLATDFAQEILGFSRLVVGDFQQGDSRSGEVPVRRTSTGPVTTILVRQLDDGHWWVIGATTDDITLTAPANRATVTSPVHLEGESIAFEAVVNVSLYADAAKKLVVGEGTVMGGGTEKGPFTGSLDYDLQGSGAKYGVLVLYTLSAEDGTVVNATAIRVRFG